MLERAGVLARASRRPELVGQEIGYYRAFAWLHTARPIGFGPAPIPITAILDFARAYRLSETFVAMMVELDRRYLVEVSSAQSRSTAKAH